MSKKLNKVELEGKSQIKGGVKSEPYLLQQKLSDQPLRTKPKLSKPYSKGAYNKYDDEVQYIRISEGCPNM